MQNLQTKYDFHSAQTAYLSQFQLIEQEETTQERPQRDIDFDCNSFNFSEVEKPQKNDEIMNFGQYLDYTLNISVIIANAGVRRILQQILLWLFGELFQEGYLLLINSSPCSIVGRIKWLILGHLFLFFICLWVLPFFTLVIICSLFYYLTQVTNFEQSLSSQFQKLAVLPKNLNLASTRLKLIYLNLCSCYTGQKGLFLSHTIDELLQSLQQKFDLTSSNLALYAIDRLDEIIYRIVTKIKLNDYQSQFIRGNYWDKKISYCKSKLNNHRLKSTIQLINQTILVIQSVSSWDRQNKRQRQTSPTLYYKILAQKIDSLKIVSTPSQSQKTKMKILTVILNKQRQFRHIRMLREQPETKLQPKNPDQTQQSSISLQFLPFKTEIKALCFQDDRVEEYKPQNIQDIRHRLEIIIKDRLSAKEQAKSQQKNEEINKQIILEETKKQRVAFGIPIPPPKKDMSAYYIQ